MKLQIALDRVSLVQAKSMAITCKEEADILEIGTSLIKDYGMEAIRSLHRELPFLPLLADMKTMDQGAYEFRAAYTAGASYATVMGAAPLATLHACYTVAREEGEEIMIDLLETSDHKIEELAFMTEAIFCVHLPKDGDQSQILEKLQHFRENHPALNRIAVAGGIQYEQLPLLKKQKVEVCIVGSAITAASDLQKAARLFAKAMQQDKEVQ